MQEWKKKSVKKIQEVDEDLDAFTSKGNEVDVREIMHQIEAVMSKATTSKGKARFTDFKGASNNSELAKLIEYNDKKRSENYNTLHDAHYKYVNTLSSMEPIGLYLDPTNMLPAVIRGTEVEQDKEVEDVLETDEYQRLAAENKMEMSAEEKEALADWLLNPNAYTNTSMDDLEVESVPAREGPPTHEQRREAMGGNAPGTIDGLSSIVTGGFNLVYYLTVDDAVVLLNPNSTIDERLISGFFLLPTPGKFAKPFLKHADDVGGAINKTRKTTPR